MEPPRTTIASCLLTVLATSAVAVSGAQQSWKG